jgi:hypothetical protein
MFINVDHFTYYDYISNAIRTTQVENSTYQLVNGDPGATSILTDTFTNITTK